jgi:adenosylcobyric acid synthase
VAALIVLGTSSWAGKSLVATGLCRWFARRGISVTPFKAQNMSNNARVGAGGEMGAAQYWQALAAGIEPEVRMNPLLVKPEADDQSQVVVCGRVDRELSRADWRRRAPVGRPAVRAALSSLLEAFELVVIEGAGSPAEINLTSSDLSNLYVTELTGANNLLVSDVGRGGALAHLFGTWSLMPSAVRARTGGFVLNRFRGDPALLDPAPAQLERMTGVPTVGVLPELVHRLPDEDGVASRPSGGQGPRVAVVRYPTASNLDEFRVLEEAAELVWARRCADLAGAELVVLPGSKQPLRDLEWLHASGLAEGIRAAATDGLRVLGICGGLQLLGRQVEGRAALGLLPLETTFAEDKLVTRRDARFGALAAPWQALSGMEVAGYEIRQGRTRCDPGAVVALSGGLGFVAGAVLGVYLHGLLEDPAVVEALTGVRPEHSLEAAFDQLADAVDDGLDMRRIHALAGLGGGGAPKRTAPEAPTREAPAPRSLVLVNTGDGKGKSTAAFGVLLRAVARRGWRVCVVQFIKSGRWKVGEEASARRLGVEWVKGGDGFSWESRDLVSSEERARDAWRLARERIAGGEYQLVVLDEVTYPINWAWIDAQEVVEVISGRPERVNVIATGRDAPPALISVADTVTEMVKVRHAYDRGIKARRGLDF